jgi:hypothetical protein
MKCQLCQVDFKTKPKLDAHLLRKTACISAETILQQLELKNSELNYTKNKMKTTEDHADMFRKLHVRTQKQLAEWKKEHENCSVTLEKHNLEEPKENPIGEKTTVSVDEYFSNPDNFSNPEDAIPMERPKFKSNEEDSNNSSNSSPSPPGSPPSFYKSDDEFGSNMKWNTTNDDDEDDDKGDNDMTFTSVNRANRTCNAGNADKTASTFSYRPKNGTTLKQPDSIKAPTNWSSWEGNSSTTRNNHFSAAATGAKNKITAPFGTAEWGRQFTTQFAGNKFSGGGTKTRLPNGQVIDTSNMTTTNTTTTNITNNIININVKLCAPGFESIHMTDSRGMTFSMIKKQKIADHLQKLLEIMTDDDNNTVLHSNK